jgi:GDPmannose 4,6-dehydratase
VAKTALVTGITGQDGAYLAKFLLENGYRVVGGARRARSLNQWRLAALGILDDVEIVSFELFEFSNIFTELRRLQPDEIYNLAAMSFVGVSFEQPTYTGDIDALGVTRLLEATREACPSARFYQASTSEMFGVAQTAPQNETTPFHPRSPYGIAKLYAHWMTRTYREVHDTFACSGILFNHESPLRGRQFVTRKITHGLARIRHGRQPVLEMGNLAAQRDWGFAGDYVEAMWRMLQQDDADDYVIATGVPHSVEDFVNHAADALGIGLDWDGEGARRVARDRVTGDTIIRVNPKFYRAGEVDKLVGDASRARRDLGWTPRHDFGNLVEMMVRADNDRVASRMDQE